MPAIIEEHPTCRPMFQVNRRTVNCAYNLSIGRGQGTDKTLVQVDVRGVISGYYNLSISP